MKRVAFCFLIFIAQFSFGQDSTLHTSKFDSENIAILKHFSYDKGAKYTKLTNTDLILVDEIIDRCLSEYNRGRDTSSYEFLKSSIYKRQYVPFIKNGQKYVWVNFFCGDVKQYPYWRKKPVLVFDGGNCYFNVTINLSTEKYFSLYINGMA